MAELDATYGGSASDSYITVADADVYIRDYCLNPAGWVNNPVKQAIALRNATTLIDAAAPWHGARLAYNQRLEFPRMLGQVDAGPRVAGDAFMALISADEYGRQQRERVRAACCVQAVHILNEGPDVDRAAQMRGASSRSLGHRFSESMSFGRPHLHLCAEAWDQIGPYEGDPKLVRGSSTLVGSRPGIIGTGS